MIEGMNHFTVLTDDLDGSVDFYVNLLGLAPGPRPELGFPGAWLYSNGQPVHHMAFTARGLKAVAERLDSRGVDYELRRQRGSNTWQLFCHDPNGAKVELDFAPTEER